MERMYWTEVEYNFKKTGYGKMLWDAFVSAQDEETAIDEKIEEFLSEHDAPEDFDCADRMHEAAHNKTTKAFDVYEAARKAWEMAYDEMGMIDYTD